MGRRGEGLLRRRGPGLHLPDRQRGLRHPLRPAGRRRRGQDRRVRDVRRGPRRRRRELRLPLGHQRRSERAGRSPGDHGLFGRAVRHRGAARVVRPRPRGPGRGADRRRLPLRQPFRHRAGAGGRARPGRDEAHLPGPAQRAPGRIARPAGRGGHGVGGAALHRRSLRLPQGRGRHVHDRVPGDRVRGQQGRHREVPGRAAPRADGDRPAPRALQALPPAVGAGEVPGPGGRAGVRNRRAHRLPPVHQRGLRRDPAVD